MGGKPYIQAANIRRAAAASSAICATKASSPAKRFSFRAQAPLFAGQPIALTASDDGLQALRCDGTVAMQANAG